MSLLIAAPFAHSTEQVYIEDKKRDATGAVVHADKQTVLLEAQRSLLAITHSCRLSCVLIVEGKKKARLCRFFERTLIFDARPEDAQKICIPAVHTSWPKVLTVTRTPRHLLLASSSPLTLADLRLRCELHGRRRLCHPADPGVRRSGRQERRTEGPEGDVLPHPTSRPANPRCCRGGLALRRPAASGGSHQKPQERPSQVSDQRPFSRRCLLSFVSLSAPSLIRLAVRLPGETAGERNLRRTRPQQAPR